MPSFNENSIAHKRTQCIYVGNFGFLVQDVPFVLKIFRLAETELPSYLHSAD